MNKICWIALPALLAGSLSFAQTKDIRIGLIYDKSGPLEAYFKQTQAGLMMGLDYATAGRASDVAPTAAVAISVRRCNFIRWPPNRCS